jgi:sec-independent protein translocase protein TatB
MGSLPPIQQANISMSDSLLLMVLALVVFGPRRLPQIGRQIGKLMYEFRKASNDFKFQMEEELRNSEEADRRKREEAERQQRLAFAAQNPPAQNPPVQDAAAQNPAAENPAIATETDAQPPDAASSAYAAGSTASVPETRPEEGYPRIAPPSTGETVAAARPKSASAHSAEGAPTPAPIQATIPTPVAEKIPPDTESSFDESRDGSIVTEKTTHNG